MSQKIRLNNGILQLTYNQKSTSNTGSTPWYIVIIHYANYGRRDWLKNIALSERIT
jgi:hypothetical protein